MKSTNDYDGFEAYKRIYVDGKGVPKKWLEKHYKGHGIFGYGNQRMGKA